MNQTTYSYTTEAKIDKKNSVYILPNCVMNHGIFDFFYVLREKIILIRKNRYFSLVERI